MICVYALGPLGRVSSAGTGALAGRLNAYVAPSEAEAFGGVAACFSIPGFGSGGTGKIGVGTETIGVGAT